MKRDDLSLDETELLALLTGSRSEPQALALSLQ